MRLKLKYALPTVQTFLAIALLVWTYRWEMALLRTQDMPGTPPCFTLLIAVNAPLAIPRMLVFRYLRGWWDDVTLVVAIGVFWYWVSLNIESWRQSRRVCMFSWIPLRLTGDTIAVGVGAVWLFMLWRNYPHYGFSWADWMWLVPSVCLILFWSLTLIAFFGRDLFAAFCTKSAKRTHTNLS
jgi:hypothetical protein